MHNQLLALSLGPEPPFSARLAANTAASKGFLEVMEDAPWVLDDVVEWVVVPLRVVTNTVVDDVLTTQVDTVITVDVNVELVSLTSDTVDTLLPCTSSLSLANPLARPETLSVAVATADDTAWEGDATAAEVVATCASVVAGIFVLPVLAGGEVMVGGVAAAPDGVLPRSFCAVS